MIPSKRLPDQRENRLSRRRKKVYSFTNIDWSKLVTWNPSTFRQHLWSLRKAPEEAKAHQGSLVSVQELCSSLPCSGLDRVAEVTPLQSCRCSMAAARKLIVQVEGRRQRWVNCVSHSYLLQTYGAICEHGRGLSSGLIRPLCVVVIGLYPEQWLFYKSEMSSTPIITPLMREAIPFQE